MNKEIRYKFLKKNYNDVFYQFMISLGYQNGNYYDQIKDLIDINSKYIIYRFIDPFINKYFKMSYLDNNEFDNDINFKIVSNINLYNCFEACEFDPGKIVYRFFKMDKSSQDYVKINYIDNEILIHPKCFKSEDDNMVIDMNKNVLINLLLSSTILNIENGYFQKLIYSII